MSRSLGQNSFSTRRNWSPMISFSEQKGNRRVSYLDKDYLSGVVETKGMMEWLQEFSRYCAAGKDSH